MYDSARTLITALGGYRSVAERMRIQRTTLHGYITGGKLPAKWYSAMIELTAEKHLEPPSRDLFSFESLPPEEGEAEPAQPGRNAA